MGALWRTVVGLELLIIALIAASVLGTRAGELELASVTPVARQSLVFQKSGPLEYFYELRPGYQGETYIPPWLGSALELHYNADGLNDRFDYRVAKPKGTFRIAALGDSWTYGQFVSTKDNYTEVLEDILNHEPGCSERFEVLNLGVPSYDIAYAAERFRVRGAKYDPDLVLWLFIANDFEEINDYIIPRAQAYRDRWTAEGVQELIERDTISAQWNSFTIPPSELETKIWRNAVDDLYREYGTAGVLSYQGEALRSFAKIYDRALVLFVHSQFTFPAPYRSLLQDVAASRPGTFFYQSPLEFTGAMQLPDKHPSPAGHREIARDLFRYLRDQRLVPCA